MWNQGYEFPSNLLTSAEGRVFSSTQVEMIAIAKDLDFAESNYVGRSIFSFSDSLSSLSQMSSSHWKSSLSDTKLRLLRDFRRVCQVCTATLDHPPSHSGIW